MSLILRTTNRPVFLAGSILLLLFLSACSDKVKTNLNVFKALDESLINSNATIQKGSQEIYHSLEKKLSDPATGEKAKLWYPKAMLIRKLSTDVYSYIEELKMELKNEAGFKPEDNMKSFNEDGSDVVTHLIEEHGKGKELYERLTKYKTDILAIDPEIRNEFDTTIVVTTQSFNTTGNKQLEFNKTFFDDIPVVAALAILSKFQNNIKINENRMISFCDNKVASYSGYYTYYSAFVGQSSSYVRTNEEIEITAAVGSFARSAMPEILVNGKNVPLGEDGAAHYKFKASNKPGKHIVRVKVSYTDLDGTKQTIEKDVEYTVADETGQKE